MRYELTCEVRRMRKRMITCLVLFDVACSGDDDRANYQEIFRERAPAAESAEYMVETVILATRRGERRSRPTYQDNRMMM